jgi:hypothetical protein
LFSDDVVLLIKPSVGEASAVVELLRQFGEASGLNHNLEKRSVSPIRCDGVDLQPALDILGCPIKAFPIQYLGLPLSIYRLSKADLQPLVDKIAGGVSAWTATLLKKSGRLVYINAKLAAGPIYHMISLDLPPWFFWSAAVKAKRGSCVVAWDTICKPKELGALALRICSC